jgi:predicted MFS family arabinose efflux permease
LTGGGVGSILLPILAHHMIVNYGWRSAYLALGITALVVGFPLTAMFVRERPAVADGRLHHADAGLTFGQAIRSRVIWIMFASILLYAFSANGAIAHLSAILVGYGAGSGAAALSVMGAAGIAGRLVTGYLLDRFFAPRVSFVLLLMVCAALVMLAHAHTAAWGILCAAILGFGMGSEIDVTPYLLARYCGLKSLSMLYGCSWTAYAFGAAFGPVLVGKAFDLRGGYAPGLVELLALPSLIAAGLTLFLPAYAQGPATSPQAVPETLLSPPAIAE